MVKGLAKGHRFSKWQRQDSDMVSLAPTLKVFYCYSKYSSVVQKRVNIAGLRLLYLKKPVCEVGPWLASENLDFGRVPAIPRTAESGSSGQTAQCGFS